MTKQTGEATTQLGRLTETGSPCAEQGPAGRGEGEGRCFGGTVHGPSRSAGWGCPHPPQLLFPLARAHLAQLSGLRMPALAPASASRPFLRGRVIFRAAPLLGTRPRLQPYLPLGRYTEVQGGSPPSVECQVPEGHLGKPSLGGGRQPSDSKQAGEQRAAGQASSTSVCLPRAGPEKATLTRGRGQSCPGPAWAFWALTWGWAAPSVSWRGWNTPDTVTGAGVLGHQPEMKLWGRV